MFIFETFETGARIIKNYFIFTYKLNNFKNKKNFKASTISIFRYFFYNRLIIRKLFSLVKFLPIWKFEIFETGARIIKFYLIFTYKLNNLQINKILKLRLFQFSDIFFNRLIIRKLFSLVNFLPIWKMNLSLRVFFFFEKSLS